MNIYDFILKHEEEDIARLLFKKEQGIPDMKWVVQQIEGRKIAKYKIPSFYAHKYIHYPKKVSLEQCSSQFTAQYKASLMQGETYIDLTGGFGIDTIFCAKKFEKAFYVEKNLDLVEIFTHNISILNSRNIEIHNDDAVSFLKQDKNFYSWLYIDPARRNNAGKKVFLLHDCEPDILTYWNLISQKANNILLKTSPILDIKHVWEKLPITATHVVAVKNEVKEVLYLVEQNKNVSNAITCINIEENKCQYFEGNLSYEQHIEIPYTNPQKYIYEPNKAILKAGLFKSVTEQYPIFKIAPSTHLYTSETYLPDFMGRVFEITNIIPYQKRIFQDFNVTFFNIIARNFPDTPEQIAKKLSVQVGGEKNYIIATKNYASQPLIILAQRLY